MQRTKIRTAIVGCGKVAHLHAAALKTLPASEFVAVCGSHPERRAAFAQKYGVKAYATNRSDPWRGSWQGEGGEVRVNQAPHQLDLLLWYMGEIDEMFGYEANLNHPTIEVEDTAQFNSINAVEHYHRLQINDFLQSILERRPPLVTGEQGRQTVELFTGIYRATRDRCAIRFPLLPEVERDDFDGRRRRQPR